MLHIRKLALLAVAVALPLSQAHAQQTGASVASFQCSAASSADEVAICATPGLGALDIRMATTYDILTKLVAMGQRGDLQDAQRQFLADRKSCAADIACLRAVYEKRLAVLNQAVAELASRGPF